MSTATVTWFGLAELREQLRRLPDDLAGEADHIVQGAANYAAVAARTGYASHRFTGNLQEHVEVVPGTHDRYGAAYIVRNSARHAHIFESGTEVRRTTDGWNRGRMPAGNVFIPAMIRARNEMWRNLAAMLARVTGWQVSGNAAA